MGERRIIGDIFGLLFFKSHEWKGLGRAEAGVHQGEIVSLGRFDVPKAAIIFAFHIRTGQSDILELIIAELHKFAALSDNICIEEHFLDACNHELPERMKKRMV